MRYFVVVGEADEGPFTFDQLKELAAKGEIRPDSTLRPESGGDPVAAGSLGGLFATPPPQTESVSPPSPPSYTATTGRSPAMVAAIAVALMCVVCLPVGGALLYPVFAQARLAAQQTADMSRLRKIGTATLMYASEHDDHFPPVMDSGSGVLPFVAPNVVLGAEQAVETVFKSTNPRSDNFSGNSILASQNAFAMEHRDLTLMFFDSMDWQGGVRCLLTVDGSVRKSRGDRVVKAVANKGVLSPLDLGAGSR